MESSVFWDVKLCNLLKVNQCLEEHVASISSVKEQVKQETCMKQAASKALTFDGLHNVLSQKIELFTHHCFLQLSQITTCNVFIMNYEARSTIYTQCIQGAVGKFPD
jgi:hypothetical protein